MIYFCKEIDFNENLIIELEKYCSDERIKKANQYKNLQDKKSSLLVFALFQYALKSEYNFATFKKENFSYNENGKPFFKNKDLFFSFSHCKNAVAVAISKENIGIDVQDFRTISDAVISKTMSKSEIEKIKKDNGLFYKYWTLKEAFIKLKGESICQDLALIDCDENKNIKEQYNTLTFFYENFCLSVVSGEKFNTKSVKEVSFDDILAVLGK